MISEYGSEAEDVREPPPRGGLGRTGRETAWYRSLSGPRRYGVMRPPAVPDQLPAHLDPVVDARLVVSSPPHSRVRVAGLGYRCPLRDITIGRSSGVVAANNCQQKQVDHYHVHRATVDMDPLRKLSNDGRKALALLLKNPSDSSAIKTFQRALPADQSPQIEDATQTSRRVAAERRVEVKGNIAVQTADDSTMKTVTHYVATETVIPLAKLLRQDSAMVTQFAETMRAPKVGREAASFYRRVLRATDGVDDLTHLTHTKDLSEVSDTHTVLVLRDRFGGRSIGSHDRLWERTREKH